VTALGWTLVAVSVTGLVCVFGWLAKARYTPLPSLSSRGEEAGVPEGRDDEPVWKCQCPKCCDDLMAIAEAVADDKDGEHWQLWEQQMARAEQ
jgi:hypothetical protein